MPETTPVSQENRDKQILQIMGQSLKDPKAAKSGVEYINEEYRMLPGGKEEPKMKPQDFYGGGAGSYAPYIEKMLDFGKEKISEGENVANQINAIFGQGSHKSFMGAASKMTPDQQEAFAQFLSKLSTVEDPMRDKSFGTQARQALTRPNPLSRAINRVLP